MDLEEVQVLVGHFGEFQFTVHERPTYCWHTTSRSVVSIEQMTKYGVRMNMW